MNNLIVPTYIAYLPVALSLTFIVAHIFFKNSKIFMLDIFSGREQIANSTNKLFETGFYLLNLGFALFYMKIDPSRFYITLPETNIRVIEFTRQHLFETLSYKIGVLSVFLGVMVFFTLFMLFRGKKRTSENRRIRERLAQQKANQ